MAELKCTCGKCNVCTSRERQRAYREDPESLDRLRANDRRRYYRNKEKRRAAMDAYVATPQGRENSRRAKREWAQRNKQKTKAHYALNNAVRDGKLTKGPCEMQHTGTCRGRVEAHHDDYSKPLEVRWLCVEHHVREHHTASV